MKLSTLAALIWAAPAAAVFNDVSVEKTKSSMTCDGDFNDGVDLGAEVAEKIWKERGSSCSNIWGFRDQVDGYLHAKYPIDTSDWRKNSCHEGMKKGANQVIDKYQKQCLEDSPDECYDLGQAAAQMIAFDFCPFSAADSTSYGSPNYEKSCRSVAYGICEGAILGYIRDNGCSISSQLGELQDECEDQIDSMTGSAAATQLTSQPKRVSAEPAMTLSFMKTTAAIEDIANCFRKCEAKFDKNTSQIETCRSNCRAGNNRTGRDYKNSRNTSGSYSDGVTKGKQEAEKIWRNNGSTCSYVWDFKGDVGDMLYRKYWADTRYNQGVEDGANMIVQEYESQCFNSNADECNDLGQAAAQIIAYDYCPFSVAEDEPYGYSMPNYEDTCRDVAEGICEGALYGYIRDNGCSISTSALRNLQDDCGDQVDSMTGGSVAAAKNNIRRFR